MLTDEERAELTAIDVMLDEGREVEAAIAARKLFGPLSGPDQSRVLMSREGEVFARLGPVLQEAGIAGGLPHPLDLTLIEQSEFANYMSESRSRNEQIVKLRSILAARKDR